MGDPGYEYRDGVFAQLQQHLALLEPHFQLQQRFARGGADAEDVEAQLSEDGELRAVELLTGAAHVGARPGTLDLDDEMSDVLDTARSVEGDLQHSVSDVAAYIRRYASPEDLGQIGFDEDEVRDLFVMVDHILSAQATMLRDGHGSARAPARTPEPAPAPTPARAPQRAPTPAPSPLPESASASATLVVFGEADAAAARATMQLLPRTLQTLAADTKFVSAAIVSLRPGQPEESVVGTVRRVEALRHSYEQLLMGT